MGNIESQEFNGFQQQAAFGRRRQPDLGSLLMHQALLEALQEASTRESSTPLQREHGWDPEDKSDNMRVLGDGVTARRSITHMTTDMIRGKKGYRSGKHVFEITWPTDERGSHAMIGIATPLAPTQCIGYTYLLGATSESWGWNIVDGKLAHGGKIIGQYPRGKLLFRVPEKFHVILDAEKGTLSFKIGDEDLGVAFTDLPKHQLLKPLCMSACATKDNCDITMKYMGSGSEGATITQVSPEGEQIVSVPAPTGTSEYKFHPRCGDSVDVMFSGQVARRREASTNFNQGVVLTRQPLQTNEIFEVRLDTKVGRWAGGLEIGFTTNCPETMTFPPSMTECRSGVTLMWSGSNVVKNGTKVAELTKDLDDCTIGDKVGIVRKDDRSVHFYFNGELLPKAVRLKNNPDVVYGVVDVYGQAERVTISDKETVSQGATAQVRKTETPVKEEVIGNDPNAIMFRMRDTIDKLKSGKFPDMRATMESVGNNITQPYHATSSRKLRQRFGDHLATLGGGQELTKLLVRLDDMGMENPDTWLGINVIRSTCWNYSDASLKICKQFGQAGLFKILLADLDRYGPRRTQNEKRRFLVVSALNILHNCAKATENRQVFKDLRAVERIAPFLKSEEMSVGSNALMTIAYIVDDSKIELLEANTQVISYLLKLLSTALENPDLRGQADDGTCSALEIAMGLANIAVNDNNKATLVDAGCIPLFVKLLQVGGPPEQECSANALWELAKLDSNKPKIRQEPEAIDTLKKLTTKSDTSTAVKQSAERVLMVLKPSLPTQQRGFGSAVTTRESCEYHVLCRRFKDSLQLSDLFFDKEYDMCYCTTCHTERGDKLYYTRGQPEKDYGVPIGWSRFALKVHDRAHALNVFEKWHIAFHGTKLDAVQPILECGDLLMPGDVVMGGKMLGEREGHFTPDRKPAGFDTKQIFLSPSIRYSGCNVYSFPTEFKDPTTKKYYHAKVAFQIYINPGSYKVGPQTIGASDQIDPKFDNQEIEWFTKQRGCVILYGLLIKLE